MKNRTIAKILRLWGKILFLLSPIFLIAGFGAIPKPLITPVLVFLIVFSSLSILVTGFAFLAISRILLIVNFLGEDKTDSEDFCDEMDEDNDA